jgi:hypothetical protein
MRLKSETPCVHEFMFICVSGQRRKKAILRKGKMPREVLGKKANVRQKEGDEKNRR